MSAQPRLVLALHRMKWFVALGVLGVISVGCDERQEKHFSLQLEDGPTPQRVLVRSDNGGAVLRGAETNTVTVEADVRLRIAESRAEEAFKHLVPTIQRLSSQPTTVEIVFEVPAELRRTNPAAQFMIQMPADVDVDVVSTNGAVHVHDITGAAKIRTSNGAVVGSQLIGDVVANTSNGAITLHGIDGGVTAETSNGAIRVNQISGRMRAQTSNGQIKYDTQDAPQEPISLHTSNGAIHVDLPRQAALKFNLDTSNGRVEVTGGEDLQIDSKHKTHLAGSVGTDGPLLDADTSNGAIRVRFIR